MTRRQSSFRAEKSANLVPDFLFGMAEQTFEESSYSPASYTKPFNSDDLWQKTGDYSIYEDMVKDDQVSICLQLKKDLVLGKGFHFFSEGEDNEEIKQFLYEALTEDVEVPFLDQLYEIIQAYEFGFSVSEKVFKKRSDSKIALKYLRTRHPNSWLIHTDKHGVISKFEQRGAESSVFLDPKSVVHFTINSKYQNPYGVSDLRNAYTAYFVKRQIVRFYSIFLEKAASPTPVARYDKNAPQSAVDSIFAAIQKLQAKTALAIPKDVELEFLQTSNVGEAYTKGINIFNMFIGRSLFVPDLIGFSGAETGGGSFALGESQLDIFYKHIKRRRDALEQKINKEVIWPLVVANFGLVKDYPKFKLDPLQEDDAMEGAKLWLEAVKGSAFQPNDEEVNHFRSIVNFPEGEVQEKPMPTNPLFGPTWDKPVESVEKQEDNGENAKDKDHEDGEKEIVNSDHDAEKEGKKEFAKSVYGDTPGAFAEKVDFKSIHNLMEAYEKTILAESEPIIKSIYEDLFDQIEKKKIISGNKPERLEDIKLKNLKALKQILKMSFRDGFKDSQVLAQKDLFSRKFADPIATQAFLDLLEKENFSFVGDWAYEITKRARVEAIAAIKDGRPLSSVIDLLDGEGRLDSEIALQRYARTKFTEVMNRGRLDVFNTSDVVSAFQYSAILDDRTSDVCAGLHGKIFNKGEQPNPPLHFNCRSVLVPITVFEKYEVDTKVGSKTIQEHLDLTVGRGFDSRKPIAPASSVKRIERKEKELK